jgi:hypothetical protein
LGSVGLFGFQINHNDGTGSNLFNGNMSQTLWKTISVNSSSNAVIILLGPADTTGRYNVSKITYDLINYKNGHSIFTSNDNWRIVNIQKS